MTEREVSMMLSCKKGKITDTVVHLGPDNNYIPDESTALAALKASMCDSCTAECQLGDVLRFVRNGLNPKK